MKRAWQGGRSWTAEGEVGGDVIGGLHGTEDGDAVGGQCGDRRRREWPARDVMGILVFEDGKRARWTWGVQAPAARTRRVQGRVVLLGGNEFPGEVVMRMLSRAPDEVREMERALAGWWSWTPRERQASRRN